MPHTFKADETPPRLWPVLVYALAAASAFGLTAEPVIETLDPAANKHRLRGPATGSPKMDVDGGGFPAQLAAVWQRLREGSFPPQGGPEVCRYCSFTLICPKSDQGPE